MSGAVNGLLPIASYQSLADFLQANPNRIYRYWIYRHSYTPYEQKQCFQDQSRYEHDHAHFGVLREVVPIGSGDVLLGFAEFIDDASEITEDSTSIAYYRMSDIHMVYIPKDAENYDEDGILQKDAEEIAEESGRVFFRVERNGRWITLPFSELTPDEQDKALKNWDSEALRRMCKLMAATVNGK